MKKLLIVLLLLPLFGCGNEKAEREKEREEARIERAKYEKAKEEKYEQEAIERHKTNPRFIGKVEYISLKQVSDKEGRTHPETYVKFDDGVWVEIYGVAPLKVGSKYEIELSTGGAFESARLVP